MQITILSNRGNPITIIPDTETGQDGKNFPIIRIGKKTLLLASEIIGNLKAMDRDVRRRKFYLEYSERRLTDEEAEVQIEYVYTKDLAEVMEKLLQKEEV